ncbi:hypothetical protein [Nonomuraea sp. bgisy101]
MNIARLLTSGVAVRLDRAGGAGDVDHNLSVRKALPQVAKEFAAA